jgi:inward rectifier potassium channel
MIRLSPYKNTNFTDAEAQMTLGMSIMEMGVKNKFYQLDLELSQISAPH